MTTKKENIKVWYLNHSGFAVQTASHFLIFDYYPEKGEPFWGKFDNGLINPIELKDQRVIVFSSHAHFDHYNEKIFELRDTVTDLHYVLSDDIKKLKEHDKGDILPVHFWKEYDYQDMHIKTLHSTDVGVAYFITVDGTTIYYAGDLNWWLWKGDDEHSIKTMGGEYRHEIDSLKNEKIDIAFIPADPRLEENYILGIDYFLRTVDTKVLFPMHFWGRYKIFDWIQNDRLTIQYQDKIKEITHRGQLFELEITK
ncbi:MBL fold metallo-hydrolase [Anaeromicropila herbilytica]|uniref:Hydrolase n=1 Tax=Anaeromicropila herbilytica TaxID=2785025 RepID=A0A7R7EM65_9FIRM|nr:MBL fold metallo-hydrolase [Anaeromicropila herbilytica]BCN31436.1 hydrolase [Anaeromicropila herbilytica]